MEDRSRNLAGSVSSAVLAVAIAVAAPLPANAEEDIVGSGEYLQSCASCHGVGGRGNGHVAQFLKLDVPDLTKLSERNDGAFPFRHVVRVIDGRAEVRAHGERPMPVWGARYSAEFAGPYRGEDFLAVEQLTRARIFELVNYLEAIQQPGNGAGAMLSAMPRQQQGQPQPEKATD